MTALSRHIHRECRHAEEHRQSKPLISAKQKAGFPGFCESISATHWYFTRVNDYLGMITLSIT
jgi:hypothetical protein